MDSIINTDAPEDAIVGDDSGKTAVAKKLKEIVDVLHNAPGVPNFPMFMASTPVRPESGIHTILDAPDEFPSADSAFVTSSNDSIPVKSVDAPAQPPLAAPAASKRPTAKGYAREPEESEREFHERVANSFSVNILSLTCNTLDNFTNAKTGYLRASTALAEAKATALALAADKGKKEQKKEAAARVKKLSENLAVRFETLYKAIYSFVRTPEDDKKAAAQGAQPPPSMPDQIGHVMFFVMNARAYYDSIPEERADDRALVKHLYYALRAALPGVRAPYDKAKSVGGAWGKMLLAPPPYITDRIRTLLHVKPADLIIDDFVTALHEAQRMRMLAAEVWFCYNVMNVHPTCVTDAMATKLKELSMRHAVVFGPLIAPLEPDDPAQKDSVIDRDVFTKTVEASTFYLICSDIVARADDRTKKQLFEDTKEIRARYMAEYNVEARKLREIQVAYMERNPHPDRAAAFAAIERGDLAGVPLQEAKERLEALNNYANYWKNPHPMVEAELKEVEIQFNKTVNMRAEADAELAKFQQEHDQMARFVMELCEEVVQTYN